MSQTLHPMALCKGIHISKLLSLCDIYREVSHHFMTHRVVEETWKCTCRERKHWIIQEIQNERNLKLL